MLAIAWQYLTGRSVATDPTDRQSAEWPPHPDRVFQAVVAAWGEGRADAAGEGALRWLEALPAPLIASLSDEAVVTGNLPKVYVPVNDIEGSQRGGYSEKQLALLPAYRTRKERYFPSTFVGDSVCALIWPDAVPGDHGPALQRLCASVVRIGHSRSLVRMWLCADPPPPTWIPSSGARRACVLRCPGPGRLDSLRAAHSAGRRPATAPWVAYERPQPPAAERGSFDPRLIILRRVSGQRIGLTQVGAFTDALRKTLMSAADGKPALMELISGHQADGAPLTEAHAAYLALPFVDDPHADGHVLGLAIALPRTVAPEREFEVASVLTHWLDAGGQLLAGPAGAATFTVEDRPIPAKGLRAETWCRPASRWSTVTPIVLDRQPPRRHQDHEMFAAEEIARSCVRQGLPEPVQVAILPVSACSGAPRASAFPPLPRRGDGGGRWHTHAALTFSESVGGPVVLGAGRYRGYGLCRPGDGR